MIDRAHKVNRSNEVCTEPPAVNRGLTGIGFKPRALEGRNLIDKEDWDKIGKPSHQIQVFSWSAGNLERTSDHGLLNDLIASPYHIGLIQEAKGSRSTGQTTLFESRAIHSVTR